MSPQGVKALACQFLRVLEASLLQRSELLLFPYFLNRLHATPTSINNKQLSFGVAEVSISRKGKNVARG
jgi:hypothetical protein